MVRSPFLDGLSRYIKASRKNIACCVIGVADQKKMVLTLKMLKEKLQIEDNASDKGVQLPVNIMFPVQAVIVTDLYCSVGLDLTQKSNDH